MKLAEIIAMVINTVERLNTAVTMLDAPRSERADEPFGVAFVFYCGSTQLALGKDGRVYLFEYNDVVKEVVLTPLCMTLKPTS